MALKWVPQKIRDEVVDVMSYLLKRVEIPLQTLLYWVGLSRMKYYRWQRRYGRENQYGNFIPKGSWLQEWEKKAIIEYHRQHPLEGYRRLSYMMNDEDIVAVSASSVYRTLKESGCIRSCWKKKRSKKGTGFIQPDQPHEHWHIDFSFIRVSETFFFLCCVLDGCSRYIVSWDLRTQMRVQDAEIVLQRAREAFPEAKPRIISDRGSQFISREFREFVYLWEATHVLTSPYHPEANGKIERFFKSIKGEAIRPKTPLCLEDAQRVICQYVKHYNEVRLHSGIGYITPNDRLLNRQEEIFASRKRKLALAKKVRMSKNNSKFTT